MNKHSMTTRFKVKHDIEYEEQNIQFLTTDSCTESKTIHDLVKFPLNFPKKRYIMVFDTETTGLIPHRTKDEMPPYKLEFPIEKLNSEYPYITQLSFLVYDMENGRIVQMFNSYINIPNEVPISETVTQLTGITRDDCYCGMSIVDALNQFYIAWLNCDEIVAHNLYFDRNMISIECRRNHEKLPKYHHMTMMFYKNHAQSTCSMFLGKATLKLKKFPKLCELYELLFNEKIEDYGIPLHNSLVDTLVCLRCVLQLYTLLNGTPYISTHDFQNMIRCLFEGGAP